MSAQAVAEASQKFTWPTATGVFPEFTVAVSFSTVPEATDVTVLPAEVAESVVVVGRDYASDRGATASNDSSESRASDCAR